jgi:hypothetical protein
MQQGLMRMSLRLFFFLFFALSSLQATPTSLFWTTCTTDVVARGDLRIDIDNQFSVTHVKKGSHPCLIGLTAGLFSYKLVEVEMGVNYLTASHTPLSLNAKCAIGEDLLYSRCPSLALGVYNVGKKGSGSHPPNQNIVNVMAGKTVPWIGGRFFVGAFSGNRAMGPDRQGFMVGYTKSFDEALDLTGKKYSKWLFAADYASGKNAIGGGGVSMQYFFTPGISLQTGPVWFNWKKANNCNWQWSLQLNIAFSAF